MACVNNHNPKAFQLVKMGTSKLLFGSLRDSELDPPSSMVVQEKKGII